MSLRIDRTAGPGWEEIRVLREDGVLVAGLKVFLDTAAAGVRRHQGEAVNVMMGDAAPGVPMLWQTAWERRDGVERWVFLDDLRDEPAAEEVARG